MNSTSHELDSMNVLETLIHQLSSKEQIRVIRWITEDISVAFPRIAKDSGIVGGHARIAGTRIPVWTLVLARRLGSGDDDLLQAFPALNVDDLAAAWLYAKVYETEIEQQIIDNESD